MVYIISYKLQRPGQDYSDLYNAIKNISGTYWHHTTSAWLVETNLSAQQIFETLFPFIVDDNDELIIFRLQGEWWGRLTDQSNLSWLRGRSF